MVTRVQMFDYVKANSGGIIRDHIHEKMEAKSTEI